MILKKLIPLCCGFVLCLGTTSCFTPTNPDDNKCDITFVMSDAYNITEKGADIECGIRLSKGNESIHQYGICYQSAEFKEKPDINCFCIHNDNLACTTLLRSDTLSSFICTISDINIPNSTWQYRIFVVLEEMMGSKDTVYNSVKTFTTKSRQ